MASAEGWFCPLYDRDIAEGKCLDINYEWLGYMSVGCLDELARLTGKSASEVAAVCKACPNFPAIPEFPDQDQGKGGTV